ncbi:tetratricopeptide repeat protein [Rubripirellula tenax]|nr:tetratricopeptide repeat protein [Rubripirellula tenax]
MSASSTNDSGIQVTGSPKVSHGGREGIWVAVHPEELERVPIENSESAATETEPQNDPQLEVAPAANETSSVDPEPPAVIPTPIPPLVQKPAEPQEAPTLAAATVGVTAGAIKTATTEKPKLELKRRQQLEHHLKSNPADLDAFLELSRIYRAENRPMEARRVLQQAIQIFPDEPDLQWELEEATLSRSIQQLREVAELAGRLNTAETDRELNRCQQDWARRRIEVCEARLVRDPSLTHLRVTLAEAKYDAEMYEEAIDDLDIVLGNDEFSPSAYLLRGRCMLAMGKDLDAMVSLRACAMRRAVVAPLRTRVVALRLLCETADRLGIALTLATYRSHLQQAEQELAKQATLGS